MEGRPESSSSLGAARQGLVRERVQGSTPPLGHDRRREGDPLTGEDEDSLEDMRREIALLQECVHPNVVQYFVVGGRLPVDRHGALRGRIGA